MWVQEYQSDGYLRKADKNLSKSIKGGRDHSGCPWQREEAGVETRKPL